MSCTYKMLMVFLVAARPPSLIQGEIRLLIVNWIVSFVQIRNVEMHTYKKSLIGFDQKSWFDPRLISTKVLFIVLSVPTKSAHKFFNICGQQTVV